MSESLRDRIARELALWIVGYYDLLAGDDATKIDYVEAREAMRCEFADAVLAAIEASGTHVVVPVALVEAARMVMEEIEAFMTVTDEADAALDATKAALDEYDSTLAARSDV